MLKVRAAAAPENIKKIEALLAEYGIICSEDAEIIVVERGFKVPKGGLTVVFEPGRPDLLRKLLSAASESAGPAQSFIIGSRHNTQQIIQNDDILFFRADGNYVYAVTVEAEFEVKHKLYELEERFRGGRFVRTGKSYIVNIMKVAEIIPWIGSRLLLRIEGTEQRVEVSRSYLKSFKTYLEI